MTVADLKVTPFTTRIHFDKYKSRTFLSFFSSREFSSMKRHTRRPSDTESKASSNYNKTAAGRISSATLHRFLYVDRLAFHGPEVTGTAQAIRITDSLEPRIRSQRMKPRVKNSRSQSFARRHSEEKMNDSRCTHTRQLI